MYYYYYYLVKSVIPFAVWNTQWNDNEVYNELYNIIFLKLVLQIIIVDLLKQFFFFSLSLSAQPTVTGSWEPSPSLPLYISHYYSIRLDIWRQLEPCHSNDGGPVPPPPAGNRLEDHLLWHHPERQVEGWWQGSQVGKQCHGFILYVHCISGSFVYQPYIRFDMSKLFLP